MNTQSMRPTSPPPPLPASYVADGKWVQEHMAKLVNQYPDRWIGVVGGQVVAEGTMRGEIRAQIDRTHPDATPYVCLIERHPRVFAG